MPSTLLSASPVEPMEAEDIARGLAPGPPRPGLVPVSIIGAEDEDFENELETNAEEHNSQFQSLEQVKRRPAHLMAFLQHVALQFEPGPLLCCLHADMLASLGPKEAKKAFLDFYHSFLDKTAVLRVPVPPTVSFELDRTRPDLLSEDVQRHFVHDVVQNQQATVSRLLEDFRSKRLMGMTPWEHDLTQLEAWVGRDRASFEARERHLAERLLTHLEEMQHTISPDEEKSAAVVSAISLYMRHLGVRTKSGDKKSGRNFFRKKMMGNRRSDEPTKTKKGLSILLDAARWNRGEPQAPDFRHLKVEADAEKPGLMERRGGLGVPSRDRNVGAPGQDVPGVSPHPLSGDSPDREAGVDAPPELGDPPPQGPASLEPLAPPESTEEGADTERCPGLGVGSGVRGAGRGLLGPGEGGRFRVCWGRAAICSCCPRAVSTLPCSSLCPSLPPLSVLHFLFSLLLFSFSSCASSSSCPLPHPFFRLSFPPLLFGATALRLAPAPASLCPALQPPPSVLQAWGPCPPHSWGAGSAPCPSLCRCFGDTLVGGGGELGSIWVLL